MRDQILLLTKKRIPYIVEAFGDDYVLELIDDNIAMQNENLQYSSVYFRGGDFFDPDHALQVLTNIISCIAGLLFIYDFLSKKFGRTPQREEICMECKQGNRMTFGLNYRVESLKAHDSRSIVFILLRTLYPRLVCGP